MIREVKDSDRDELDRMQFELQKFFSEIDSTGESLPYEGITDAHRYIQKMLDDVKNMEGRIFVAEKDGAVAGFIQGVIIDHKKGKDEIYDLSHNPSREGWIGLLYVKPKYRRRGIGQALLRKMMLYFRVTKCTSVKLLVLTDNTSAMEIYEKSGFIAHELEMVMKI